MLIALPWSEMTGFDWQKATAEEVDFQYSPSKFAKRPLDEYLEEYRTRSAVVDAAGLRQENAPLLIFIHGGYWQKLSAADSLFNGPEAQAEGIALHAVEYTLAPHASITQMIEECIADVSRTITELKPTRVVLAGSSAGAHLVAMCARDPFVASHVDGVALLSGIYDVRPLVVTPTNDPLHLTTESAADISPQLLPLPNVVPHALLAVGGHEPPEFIRQNAKFGDRLLSEGSAVQILIEEHLDHFDLPYDLLRRGTKVGDWCLNILKGTEA
jgi:arylformamidase